MPRRRAAPYGGPVASLPSSLATRRAERSRGWARGSRRHCVTLPGAPGGDRPPERPSTSLTRSIGRRLPTSVIVTHSGRWTTARRPAQPIAARRRRDSRAGRLLPVETVPEHERLEPVEAERLP